MTINHYSIVIASFSILFFLRALYLGLKATKMSKETQNLNEELEKNPIDKSIQNIQDQIDQIDNKYQEGKKTFDALSNARKPLKRQVDVIQAGLLPPTFRFDDSEILKDKIRDIQQKQFTIINSGRATESYSTWAWFGSKSDGAKMVSAYNSLLLKAYNAEFDMIRKQMRYSTYSTAREKLTRLSDQLAKLAETVRANITKEYSDLKKEELSIWHQELKRKEKIKQDRKKQQQELREQNKLLGKDTDKLEDKIEEQEIELEAARRQAERLIGKERADIEKMIAKIEIEKERLEKKFQHAISQAQITRSGYIYVISNKGSFGEDVVKIGMTRRLEPMERIVELSRASVPFRYDVHTLAYTSDAPTLEKTLHKRYNEVRVNEENFRKEFFKTSPKDVHSIMDELGIESDWYYEVEAKEYNESLLIRHAIAENSKKNSNPSESFPNCI
jgi:hypothetical protein